MAERKRVIIVGATSAMAEHCARLWLQAGPVDLVLVGRSDRRLQRIASDLKVKSPESSIEIITCEFEAATEIDKTVHDLMAGKTADIILIAHGMLPEQTACEDNLTLCQETLRINGLSPVLFAEAFVRHMVKADHGTLVLIGSVAGDRGRKSNYVYGAAKGLVSRYAEGLQHRLAGTGVKVVLVKPGPTATPMTAQFAALGIKMAPVTLVAKQIVKAAGRGQAVCYTPRKWRLIMFVISHLPRWVFHRLNI